MKKLFFILFSLSVFTSYSQTNTEYRLIEVGKCYHNWPVYHVIEFHEANGLLEISVIDTVTGSWTLLDTEAILNIYLRENPDTIQADREYYVINNYIPGYDGWFLKTYYESEGVYVITNPIRKKLN